MNQSTVITYPAPPGAVGTDDFRVQVNGQDVFVYHTPVAAFACFAFSGSVEVSVTANREATGVDLRPKRHGIAASVEDRTVRFTLTQPCQLSVEINGDIARPLFLFANAPEVEPPDPNDGSVRYFEPDKIHDVGEITLKDNQTVYIPGGAVVRGWIKGEGVKGARILGHGILDGSDPEAIKAPLIAMRACRDIEVNGVIVVNDQGWTVVPVDCEDIRFTDFKLIGWNNNSDGIDIVGSKRVVIDGCFLRDKDDCVVIKATRHARNKDVKDVQVLNTVLWNAEWGNAIEIGFELQTASVSDILFADCDVIHVEKGAVFSIHNGDFTDVRNIRYEHIRVEDARDKLVDLRIGMSIYSADCPEQFSRGNPDRKRSAWGQWIRPEDAGQEGGKGRGRIRDICFKNIQVTGETVPVSPIQGFDDDHAVENVTVENLWIHGRHILNAESGKFTVALAKNVRFV